MTKTTNTSKAAAEKTFKEARKTVEKTVKAAQKTAQETVKAAQENVEKAVKEATNNLDQVSEFGKANYEALVASGEAAAKVAKSVNVDFMENARKAVEKNVTDVKTLFSAKTPAEFFEIQATMFKSRYEEFVAEATRVNEAASHTANEVVEPLKARYEEVAVKYNLPLAG
ncbi:MAG: hypothetical protein COB49_10140 [Alphaproteobacteria bacterium]|nr:MAG: hypothetical protein COB49_10140 [Alphaproteobacteria bacterium]